MSIENEIILETETIYANKENKAHEGKLYFYITGLKFVPYDNTVGVSIIPKSDIEKAQNKSNKVRLVLTSSQMCIFTFPNEKLITRIVNIIKIIKSGFEPPDKFKSDGILKQDIELESFYNEEVLSKSISYVEWWYNHQDVLKEKEITELTNPDKRTITFFNEFITEDESGNLKIEITSDIILRIFQMFPKIKNLHDKEVGILKSEKEFWEEIARMYFYRKRDRVETSEVLEPPKKYTKREINDYVVSDVNLVSTLDDEIIKEPLTDPMNEWENRELPSNIKQGELLNQKQKYYKAISEINKISYNTLERMEKEPHKDVLMKRRLENCENDLIPKEKLQTIPINIGIIQPNRNIVNDINESNNTSKQIYTIESFIEQINNYKPNLSNTFESVVNPLQILINLYPQKPNNNSNNNNFNKRVNNSNQILSNLISYIESINESLKYYWSANNAISPNLVRGKALYESLLKKEKEVNMMRDENLISPEHRMILSDLLDRIAAAIEHGIKIYENN